MKKQYFKIAVFALMIFSFNACKESLKFELDKDQIDTEEALNSPENIQALLNSCYDVFANVMDGDVQNLQELLSDNLAAPQNAAGSLYYTVYNRGTFSFRTADGVLLDLYRCIYRVNIMSENLYRFPEELNGNKMDGEAKFLRAWCHWELVKLWAQPYGFTSDNSHPGIAIKLHSHYSVELRSSVGDVYNQIIEDLKFAEQNLPDDNGVYANKNAAKALLAKVYFTMNDFTNAAAKAGEVINSGLYQLSDTVERYIADQGNEVIFKTISTGPSDNRGGSFIGSYRSDKTDNPGIKAATDFKTMYDTADHRKVWIEVVDPDLPSQVVKCHKFDKDFFGVALLNLADMYLIRAESLLELNTDKQTAASDLNAIRERAYGSDKYNVSSGSITLADVRLERRKEFAFEGDRTIQLKRMGAKGETVVIRGADWNCAGSVLQFPASEKTKGFEFNPEGGCN
ncbi:MAG: RagB/SusD family nutrient uptake outer membrane protein [Bacteroidetes bacterium]|nr:RagB/SusD family nutrient uptake outer membrane protein [Bacteroidota bacterium]